MMKFHMYSSTVTKIYLVFYLLVAEKELLQLLLSICLHVLKKQNNEILFYFFFSFIP